jgi:hypothetical protein
MYLLLSCRQSTVYFIILVCQRTQRIRNCRWKIDKSITGLSRWMSHIARLIIEHQTPRTSDLTFLNVVIPAGASSVRRPSRRPPFNRPSANRSATWATAVRPAWIRPPAGATSTSPSDCIRAIAKAATR